MAELEQSLKLLKDLIAFPTVSKDTNIDLIQYIANYLEQYKIKYNIQLDESGRKANLVATIGPADVPGIILSGHTDVVPVDNQLWNTDPFEACIDGNYLFGRGAADMKSFIAVILSRIPLIRQRELKAPIHILLTYDEEVGCHGAIQLINELQQELINLPLFCIVGEPTEMKVINAHKGIRLLKTTVKGIGCHSSVPGNGVNALTIMSKLILFLDTLAEQYQNKSHSLNSFLPWITINPGVLDAGSAVNIVPDRAQLLWEYRFVHESQEYDPLNKFRAYCKEIERTYYKGIDNNTNDLIFTEELAFVPPLEATVNSELTQALLSQINIPHAEQVNYSTEAGFFQRLLKVPTVVCGPGNIEQAHKANEYIALDQILLAERFISQIINKMYTPSALQCFRQAETIN